MQDLSLYISLFFATVHIIPGGKKYSARDIVDTSHRWPHLLAFSFCFVFFKLQKRKASGFLPQLSLTAWLYTHTYISLIPPFVLVFFLYTSFFLVHGRVVLDTTLATLRIGRRFFLSSKISCFFFFFFLAVCFFLSSHISRHCFFFYCESLAALMKWLCLFSTCPLCVTSFLFFLALLLLMISCLYVAVEKLARLFLCYVFVSGEKRGI